MFPARSRGSLRHSDAEQDRKHTRDGCGVRSAPSVLGVERQTGQGGCDRITHALYRATPSEVRVDDTRRAAASSAFATESERECMKTAPAWECQRSVDVDVPVSFAWQYMTDIRNWNDPPAEFALDGPFADGSRGTTRMPGQPPASWTIRDVEPGCAYTIEGGSWFERAQLLVHWRFDALSERRARLTQRLKLCGDNAATYVEEVRARSNHTSSRECGESRR